MATQTRLPTGDLSGFTNWTGSFTDVDDPIGTPDDDTTFITSSGNGDFEFFTFSAFTVPATATVNHVTVRVRARFTGADAEINAGVTNAGFTANVANISVTGTTYANYSRQMTTNPFTAAAWTVDQANSVGANGISGFGVRQIGTNPSRVTQVYLEVDYTEAGGGATHLVMPRWGSTRR